MKTEFIRGVEVIRVEAWHDDSCAVRSADGTQCLECTFIDTVCFPNDGGPFCENKPVIFIRPDQIVDYVAIKLVS